MYCIDLMKTQLDQGCQVGLLWPGRMSFGNNGYVSIHKSIFENQIPSYEIINPLPVPLDEGVNNINAYTKPCDAKVYRDFLLWLKPDAIHIHTLMGLHKEFIDAAKNLAIRTVYTTHDYYGLCPKVTLFKDNHTCDEDSACCECVLCNQTALSISKVRILQSGIYRRCKDLKLVKSIREIHREGFFDKSTNIGAIKVNRNRTEASDYQRLREYYLLILSKIDIIHFNSEVSKKIFSRFITPDKSFVINISHRGIADHRVIKEIDDKMLKITYLGPAKPYKGFGILVQVLDEIWDLGYQSFALNLFCKTNIHAPYFKMKNGFQQSELPNIFKNTDVLIAPSIWYETFGFTVLEALSYGVPVLVSDNVGAKDLLKEMNFCICKPTTQSLKEKLLKIYKDRNILRLINRDIVAKKPSLLFPNSIELIDKLYVCEKEQ